MAGTMYMFIPVFFCFLQAQDIIVFNICKNVSHFMNHFYTFGTKIQHTVPNLFNPFHPP